MASVRGTVWALLLLLGVSASRCFESEFSKSSLQFNSKNSMAQSTFNITDGQQSKNQFHYRSWATNSVTRVQSVHNQSRQYEIRRPFSIPFSGNDGRIPFDLSPQPVRPANIPKRLPAFPDVTTAKTTTKPSGFTTKNVAWNEFTLKTTMFPTRRTRGPRHQQAGTHPPLVHKETTPVSLSAPSGTFGITTEASPKLQTSAPLTPPPYQLDPSAKRPNRSVFRTA